MLNPGSRIGIVMLLLALISCGKTGGNSVSSPPSVSVTGGIVAGCNEEVSAIYNGLTAEIIVRDYIADIGGGTSTRRDTEKDGSVVFDIKAPGRPDESIYVEKTGNSYRFVGTVASC